MPTKAQTRRRVLREERNPGLGVLVFLRARVTFPDSFGIRCVSGTRLLSKKDADLADKQAPSVISAHRDVLRRFLHDLATPLSAVSLHLEAADRRVQRAPIRQSRWRSQG